VSVTGCDIALVKLRVQYAELLVGDRRSVRGLAFADDHPVLRTDGVVLFGEMLLKVVHGSTLLLLELQRIQEPRSIVDRESGHHS
jgi:hypothetical protein